MELIGKQRRFLRGLGAKLKAQVRIGQDGITKNIVTEVNRLLKSDELGKVKLVAEKGAERKAVALELAAATRSQLVQVLGSSVLLYRENPENRQIKVPK